MSTKFPTKSPNIAISSTFALQIVLNFRGFIVYDMMGSKTTLFQKGPPQTIHFCQKQKIKLQIQGTTFRYIQAKTLPMKHLPEPNVLSIATYFLNNSCRSSAQAREVSPARFPLFRSPCPDTLSTSSMARLASPLTYPADGSLKIPVSKLPVLLRCDMPMTLVGAFLGMIISYKARGLHGVPLLPTCW